MTDRETSACSAPSVEAIQQGWHELILRVGQLEAEKTALEQDNKALRSLLERVIEHRQKSHSELVLLLTGLVSKLPMNDLGIVISKLVEHNTNVSQALAGFVKGTAQVNVPQPEVLRTLDQTRRELGSALKPVVEELIQLETPLESQMLEPLIAEPELFFSPRFVRANRCFVKGQVPRERIVREFGEESLMFFNDMTTDPKLNPRPKPEEIALAFKPDFEALFQQNPALIQPKREDLLALYQRIQRGKDGTEPARTQKNTFQKLSFIAELLHFYEHQNTEAPDAVFAQRLPGLIEQLVLVGSPDNLEEKLIIQAEGLLAFVISPDHRQMIINNVGKSGPAGKTLKCVLRLRSGTVPESDPEQIVPELIKNLIPPKPQKAPPPDRLTPVLRLLNHSTQRQVLRAIMHSDRLRKAEAETLVKAISQELGLKDLVEEEAKAQRNVPVEIERQMAWAQIKDLLNRRCEPGAVAAAFRDRLHAKYDADEIRQSWITLIEADAISLIRIFCRIPYLANGTTDAIARPVMETYVSRLTHEKYAATYTKIVKSLKNMFAAKPDSPTLVNFMALVKWVDAEAANKLAKDIGMPGSGHGPG